MEATKKFRAILCEKAQKEEYVEIRTIDNERVRQFFYHPNKIELLLKDLRNQEFFKNVDIYFGVCPRSTRQGKEEHVKRILCFWVDLDCESDQERKDQLRKLRQLGWGTALGSIVTILLSLFAFIVLIVIATLMCITFVKSVEQQGADFGNVPLQFSGICVVLCEKPRTLTH